MENPVRFRFVEGEPEHAEEDEEEDEHRDPNIIKSSKKKEKVMKFINSQTYFNHALS